MSVVGVRDAGCAKRVPGLLTSTQFVARAPSSHTPLHSRRALPDGRGLIPVPRPRRGNEAARNRAAIFANTGRRGRSEGGRGDELCAGEEPRPPSLRPHEHRIPRNRRTPRAGIIFPRAPVRVFIAPPAELPPLSVGPVPLPVWLLDPDRRPRLARAHAHRFTVRARPREYARLTADSALYPLR